MKVMIVDNSNLLQERLMSALRKIDENMSISQAWCCKEALELFAELETDTVILDLELPDGSGIHLLQQFKKTNPSVYVAILTNLPAIEFKMRCIELGADRFFDKKNISELLLTLNEKNESLNLLL